MSQCPLPTGAKHRTLGRPRWDRRDPAYLQFLRRMEWARGQIEHVTVVLRRLAERSVAELTAPNPDRDTEDRSLRYLEERLQILTREVQELAVISYEARVEEATLPPVKYFPRYREERNRMVHRCPPGAADGSVDIPRPARVAR